MAEEYILGKVRLWYRATGFKTGLLVKADLIKPDLTKEIGLEFTEAGDGMYYTDYNFIHLGSHVVIMYEGGIQRSSQNFIILRRNGNRRGNLLNT